MKIIKKLAFVFIVSQSLLMNLSSADPCNGSEALCDLRYNKITQLVTHNSVSYKKNGWFWIVKGGNINDQDRDLHQQLRDGVRAFHLPLFFSHNKVQACHGVNDSSREEIKRSYCNKFWKGKLICSGMIDMLELCSIDPAATPLSEVLKEISQFLEENPREVITLFLEDNVRDFKLLRENIVSSPALPFYHSQDRNQPWPTLSEMIRSGKRLVVFVDAKRDRGGNGIYDVPYVNSTPFFVWMPKVTYRSVQSISEDNARSAYAGLAFINRAPVAADNKIFYLHHFVTPALAGDPNKAKGINKREFVLDRVRKYKNILNFYPNFIAMDFYEMPGGLPVFSDLN